jgi:chemotaxis protein histidine kinase CheA
MSDSSEPALQKTFADIGARYLARTQGELTELGAHIERIRGGETAALKEVELLAHRIRGSGAVFGFHQVSDAAGEIEMLVVNAVRQSDAATAQVGARAAQLLVALTNAVRAARDGEPPSS